MDNDVIASGAEFGDENKNEFDEVANEASDAGRALSRLGASKGGNARAKKLTPEKRSEIAKKAVEVRWSRARGDSPIIPKATHSGTLRIGDVEIPCAVLGDGTRLLTQEGFLHAIGRAKKAKGGQGSQNARVDQLPPFLAANNLKPFISKELIGLTKPLIFIPVNPVTPNHRGLGFNATLLPMVCRVYLDARDAGVLTHVQKPIAEQCDILARGLLEVGIVALVDEATGYQDVRDRKALQEILDKYLRKEFAAWAKAFPDEFYREIFRLRKWEWRGMKVNRPQVVAHYTKDLIYARLAPGILKELEEKNPKGQKGHRRTRHHQWLTEDIGHPALAQHLHAVIGIMRTCDTWKELMNRVDRAFPKRGDTLQLPLFEDEDYS